MSKSSVSRLDTCGRTDGQTDMTKIIGTICDFMKATKNTETVKIIIFISEALSASSNNTRNLNRIYFQNV